MANVKTKKNCLPMNLAHRDFNNKYNWQGKCKATLPPPIPDPVYPERPKTFTDPPFTLTSTKRISYQWPTFTDEMVDDIRKGRFDYKPNTKPAIGITPALNPPIYPPVPYFRPK